MEIFWNREDQKFHTIPDGDIATHKEINDYFISCMGSKINMDEYIPKDKIRELVKEIKIDIQRNNKKNVEVTENNDGSISFKETKIYYDPEIVKARLERLL